MQRIRDVVLLDRVAREQRYVQQPVVVGNPHVRGSRVGRQLDHPVEHELAVLVFPIPDRAGAGAVDEPAARRRPVLPAHFQRHLVEVLDLEHRAGLPVPHHDLIAHVLRGYGVPPEVVRVRPARRDDAVELGLDADVVHVARVIRPVRRRQCRDEVSILIEPDERARAPSVLGAEHRDQHAARHGIVGVWAGVTAQRAQVGDRLDQLGPLRIGLDVVDEQPVRDEAAREDAVRVHRVAEVVRLIVHSRAGRHGREDLAVAGRLGIRVDDREEVGLLGVRVTGPHVQQRFVLVRPQVLHEHGLVFRARRHRPEPRRQGEEQQQRCVSHGATSLQETF